MPFEFAAIAKPLIGPVVKQAVKLQNFFFARPRLDIDLVPNNGSIVRQKAIGVSGFQDPATIDHDGSIPVTLVKYDLEFSWNYKLIIKNNSSKTAYEIKIEKIYVGRNDYLETIDNLASLKEGDQIELEYIIRYYKPANGREAEEFRKPFPYHLDKIEILVSYTNEARTKYYTLFSATSLKEKVNEHLFRRPKNIAAQ